MSSTPQPPIELGRQLLQAGREEVPSRASIERAHQQVDALMAQPHSAPHRRAPRRWLRWGLPAAAAALVAGVALAVMFESGDESVATPATTVVPSLQLTPVAVAPPSASASTSASAVARETTSSAPATSAPPTPLPRSPHPEGARCGCAPNDLMCQMSCASKPSSR